MRSPEELLEAAAADGSFDSNEWPRVLDFVLSRLKESVHNDFPRPSTANTSQINSPKPTIITFKNDEPLSQESQTANKENNPPPRLQRVQSQGAVGSREGDADFPADIQLLYNAIRSNLAQSFPTSPPHTIQRLAELILHPRQHYRFLPPYLHALDRVLSVSSSTEAFPLPQAFLPPGNGLLNGTTSVSTPSSSISSSSVAASNLGSDESLGGALLTPIPWLRPERDHQSRSEFKPESTETVDGPNGTGTIETVSVVNGHLSVISTTRNASAAPVPPASSSLRDVGGVTQGELLRQEQEAGIVPVTQTGQRLGAGGGTTGSDGHAGAGGDHDDDADVEVEDGIDDQPHARGPENVGMEDTGPQSRPPGSALDLTAAVGRPVVQSDVTMEDGEAGEAGGKEGRDDITKEGEAVGSKGEVEAKDGIQTDDIQGSDSKEDSEQPKAEKAPAS